MIKVVGKVAMKKIQGMRNFGLGATVWGDPVSTTTKKKKKYQQSTNVTLPEEHRYYQQQRGQ
ncbi:hypothetical protein [Pseudomonas aeruginosa]|uniref:hypothetical protein n=1 Tax=Pseudomonas aeruginosa TaxID=287 RepID=UPI00374A9389